MNVKVKSPDGISHNTTIELDGVSVERNVQALRLELDCRKDRFWRLVLEFPKSAVEFEGNIPVKVMIGGRRYCLAPEEKEKS